jgi:hypothetical protein
VSVSPSANFSKAWKQIAKGPRGWAPSLFFLYDLAIVIALLLLGPFHPEAWHLDGWLGNPFPDILPSVVPWAGALGGVGISLVGVAGHAKKGDWQPESYGYWHLTRAMLGAIFGSVAVLIITLILQNVKQAAPTDHGFTHSGEAVLAIIAFVVGFREETFRSLIVRVVDVILGPSASDVAATYTLAPQPIDFGTATVRKAKTTTIHLFNASPSSMTMHMQDISVQGDGLKVTLSQHPTTIASGESGGIDLTWTPAEPGPLNANIQVKVPGSVITASITGHAKHAGQP